MNFLLLLFYVLPIFLCYLFHYLDEETKTIGDLFEGTSYFFVPFMNIIISFMFFGMILNKNSRIEILLKKISKIRIKKNEK